jgi:hypothetical protein
MDAEAIDRIINSLAASQHGVMVHRQLIDLGVSHSSIHRRRESGRLEVVGRSLYRVPSVPSSWPQRAMGYCLTSGRDAVLSHRCAAMLWQMGIERAPFELVVPRWQRVQRQRGVIVHETNELPPRDIDRVGLLPCTSPVRTLLDLAAVVSTPRLDSSIETALRSKLCTTEALVDRFVQWSKPGRRGVRRLRPLLEMRHGDYVPTHSEFEFRLLPLIERAGLPEPARQHRVELRDRPAFLDFGWPEAMLGVECDGMIGHGNDVRLPWDDDRQNEVQLKGWLVLRFTYRMLRSEPGVIESQLREAYCQRTGCAPGQPTPA